MYKGDIPFDRDTGHPMYYAQHDYEWEYKGRIYRSWMEIERKFGKDAVKEAERLKVGPDWRPNEPFRAVMEFVGMSRGRSAANFDLKDEHGIPYTMFMTDVLDLMKRHSIKKGKTDRLEWAFCKRGQNYGVKLAQ